MEKEKIPKFQRTFAKHNISKFLVTAVLYDCADEINLSFEDHKVQLVSIILVMIIRLYEVVIFF